MATPDRNRKPARDAPGRVAPSRRAALRALAGLLMTPAWTAARAADSKPTPLNAPQPIAQIHVTAAGALLAVSAAGVLWEHSSGRWTQRAAQLEPGTPIASGHGRVAGRSALGTLWVLESGLATVSAGPTLTPDGGLHVLPLGVIAVAQGSDGRAFAVRLEPGRADHWTETARAIDPVLPDARPLQVDLDRPGGADDGHIVLLAGPDATRYRHGALGDEIEATRMLYLERHALEPLRSLLLPAQDRRRLRIFDAAAGWSERSPLALPAAVAATRPLRLDSRPGCALLLEDGAVWWAAPTA